MQHGQPLALEAACKLQVYGLAWWGWAMPSPPSYEEGLRESGKIVSFSGAKRCPGGWLRLARYSMGCLEQPHAFKQALGPSRK